MNKLLQIGMSGYYIFGLSYRLSKVKYRKLEEFLKRTNKTLQEVWYDEDLIWEIVEEDIWDWEKEGSATCEISSFVFKDRQEIMDFLDNISIYICVDEEDDIENEIKFDPSKINCHYFVADPLPHTNGYEAIYYGEEGIAVFNYAMNIEKDFDESKLDLFFKDFGEISPFLRYSFEGIKYDGREDWAGDSQEDLRSYLDVKNS